MKIVLHINFAKRQSAGMSANRIQYDSLPLSNNRGLIGRRPSVLRAFASVVGIFAVSTLAYRMAVPLESSEPWLQVKGNDHYFKLFQGSGIAPFNAQTKFLLSQDSDAHDTSKRKLEVNPVVRKLMHVAASHIRTRSSSSKVKNKKSARAPSSDWTHLTTPSMVDI